MQKTKIKMWSHCYLIKVPWIIKVNTYFAENVANTKKRTCYILDSAVNPNFVYHKGLTGNCSFPYLIVGDRPQNWHRYSLGLRSVAQGPRHFPALSVAKIAKRREDSWTARPSLNLSGRFGIQSMAIVC